jgi:nicotinamide-nucleotide adenylyltransferase
LKKVDELILVIGSAQYSHQLRNPFSAGERLLMIRKCLEEGNVDDSKIWIVPVNDVNVHTLWVAAVKGYVPPFEIVFTNDALSRRLFIEAGYQVNSIPLINRKMYSSTEVRRRMLSGEDWTDLVPLPVEKIINIVDGVRRIQDLSKRDVVPI